MPLPSNPGESLWIGSAGGKNHFNVGIGQGTSGGQNHTDFSQALIEDGYTDPNKFFLAADGSATFRINAGAGRTSQNTAHPRSELREYLANGTTKAAWDGRSGVHYMRGRSRITEVTSNRPWVCFAQIHGSENSPEPSDLVRLQTEGATGTTTNLKIVCRRSPPSGGSEIVTTLRTGYNVNDWFNWEIRMESGRLKIILDGVTVLDVTGMGQIGNYFKAGCYLQDNVEKGANANDWAAVEIAPGSLQVWHTGDPNPTTPIFTGGPGGGSDVTPPTIPSSVAGIRGDQQVTLSWQGSTDDVGVANYKIYRSSGGAAGVVGKSDDSEASSASSTVKLTVTRVTPEVSGTTSVGHARCWLSASGSVGTKIVIYADNANQPGALIAASNETVVTATTEGVRDYSFASPVSLTAGVNYWIGLMWNDPGTPSLNLSRGGDANQRLELTGFTYPTAPNPFGTPSGSFAGPVDVWVETGGTTLVASPTSTTYTNTGLTNGVQYGYSISAIDAAGNESARSDAVLVTPGPPDLTPPTVPTGLAATAGDRVVSLTWNASTDADTGVAGYRVYRGGVLVNTTTDTAWVDVDRTNTVTYSYRVSAVDGSGNESAQATAVTATPTAPAIGGVSWLSGSHIQVRIAFGADVLADPASWSWTDVTTDVFQNPGISTSLGRNDESSESNPANLTLTLNNKTGNYSLGGRSTYYPYVRRNTPVQVRVDPGDGIGARVLFFGYADGFTPSWDLTGKIPTVELSASGMLRRLSQGDSPVVSAYRRAMTSAESVIAYWPFEEGSGSRFAPAVRGGTDMQLTLTTGFAGFGAPLGVRVVGRPDWDSCDSFNSSAKLPLLKDAAFTGTVNPYTSTGENQIRFLMSVPEDGLTDGTTLIHIHTSGGVRWGITYGRNATTGSTVLGIFRMVNGVEHSHSLIGFDVNGKPCRFSLELKQVGSDIQWTVSTLDLIGKAGYITDTLTNQTNGVVTLIEVNPHGHIGDIGFGHLTVENKINSVFTDSRSLFAYDDEFASSSNTNPITSRLERLADENNIPLTRHTLAGSSLTDYDRMGPQLTGTLLNLLREAETADQGQLWDGRGPGLSYTTRRRREDGTVRMVITSAAGEFKPVDDDQRNRNKVTVTRRQGVTATYEDKTGPLGSDAIGVYDDSLTVNHSRDDMAMQFASWLVHQGTVQGYRYPSVTLNLRANPEFIPAVLDLIPGERIDINLGDTLQGLEPVSLIVEGVEHDITAKSWLVTFKCSMFAPWGVGQIAAETGDTSDMVMRLDTDGSALTSNRSAGATSITVTTPWTTRSDDYPMYLSVGGVRVRATACSGTTLTVDALPVARSAGASVALWEPRRIGLG